MGIDELCALPVADLAARDSALFLWATFPQLPEALRLIKAWGFQYKSVAFVWLKKNKKADSWFYGLGFWTRGNAEVCLLATRGHPRRQAANIHQFIISPIEAHSKKPDERPGKRLLPSWAICPMWSCSQGRPRPAGMCGEMKLQVRSRTLGGKGKESGIGGMGTGCKATCSHTLGIMAADIQLLESAGICRCLYSYKKGSTWKD